MPEPASPRVLSNPDLPCPPELLARITSLEVPYTDFDGASRVGTIEVHEDVAGDVTRFFAASVELAFPIEGVVRSSDEPYRWDDHRLLAANVSSGFNYRLIAGTDRVSLHGQGLAIDINPRLNPYLRFVDGETIVDPPGATWEPDRPGTLFDGHPLVTLLADLGWEWGGDWTEASGRIDYQHFQRELG